MSKNYRWCIISQCKNTSVKSKEKTFISVPIEKAARQIWIENCGRNPAEFSSTSVIYVCEDHFDVSIVKYSHIEYFC